MIKLIGPSTFNTSKFEFQIYSLHFSFFQQIIGEWKAKHDDLTTELGESHREMRNYHCETVRLRSFHEEIIEQLDVVKRENKNLADEIKDLLEQVSMVLF